METKQENLGTTIRKEKIIGRKQENLGATIRKYRIMGKETRKPIGTTLRKAKIIGKETRKPNNKDNVEDRIRELYGRKSAT